MFIIGFEKKEASWWSKDKSKHIILRKLNNETFILIITIKLKYKFSASCFKRQFLSVFFPQRQ